MLARRLAIAAALVAALLRTAAGSGFGKQFERSSAAAIRRTFKRKGADATDAGLQIYFHEDELARCFRAIGGFEVPDVDDNETNVNESNVNQNDANTSIEVAPTESPGFHFLGMSAEASQEFGRFVDGYLNGFGICGFIEDLVNHTNGGCGPVLVDLISSTDENLACIVAMSCIGHATGLPNAVHGLCYRQCANSVNPDGSVTTACPASVLELAGLTDEHMCGDTLRPATLLGFGGFLEILMTFWFSAATSAFELFIISVTGSDFGVDPVDILSLWFNTALVLYTVYTAVAQMAEVSNRCRFVLLSTPMAFLPYLYAMSRGFGVAAKVQAKLEVDIGFRQRGEEPTEHSNPTAMARALRFIGGVLAGVAVLVFNIIYLCQCAVAIAMGIASCWGSIAYIHITLILIAVGAISCAIFLLVVRGVHALPHVFIEADAKNEHVCTKMFKNYKMVVKDLKLLLYMAASAIWSLFAACSFMLCFHGDYMKFHSAFFGTVFLSPPNLPDFKAVTIPKVSFEALLRIAEFKFVDPSIVLQITIVASGCFGLLKVVYTVSHAPLLLWRKASHWRKGSGGATRDAVPSGV